MHACVRVCRRSCQGPPAPPEPALALTCSSHLSQMCPGRSLLPEGDVCSEACRPLPELSAPFSAQSGVDTQREGRLGQGRGGACSSGGGEVTRPGNANV